MYDLVHKRKRLVIVVLVIIAVPFLFTLPYNYFFGEHERPVATFGDHRIGFAEFSQALRQQQEQMRQVTRGQIDPELLDGPDIRAAVLDGIIRQRLMTDAALGSGLVVSDAQLQQIIAQIPAFQENGNFSPVRYRQVLQAQNMTPVMFEERLRGELLIDQLGAAFIESTLLPTSVVDRLLRAAGQQREASRVVIAPEPFLAKVQIGADEVRAFFDGNRREFEVPEQARIEYVMLALEQIMKEVAVTADDVKAFYAGNVAQFRAQEEREASHILIRVAPGADAPTRKAALAEAERIAAEVRRNPAAFGDLARKHSQDPASAARGGALGFFPRGAMVRAFDEAVFRMKPGEIAGPVETEFGYHVIRLASIRGGDEAGFEPVRAKVEMELRRQLAAKRFAELAETLSNLAFEQSDSLKPIVEQLGLPIRQSDWLGRRATEPAPLANRRLLEAVFSEDVLKDARNTQAIDIGNQTLVVARLLEYRPTGLRSFEEVAGGIEKRLRFERAHQLAVEAGRTQLEALRAGRAGVLPWTAPQLVSRDEPRDLDPALLRQLFRADVSRLPAYTGVEAPGGGYALLRITRVADGKLGDPRVRQSFLIQATEALGQEQLAAYLGALRNRARVTVDQGALQRRDR